ncbi:hypothetical protein C8R45DRAFT_301041 [Mycena sanguinolenta]|nr:hypothetical protein C8R45DRAFT_301041 [Mycena sanguinolenta]
MRCPHKWLPRASPGLEASSRQRSLGDYGSGGGAKTMVLDGGGRRCLILSMSPWLFDPPPAAAVDGPGLPPGSASTLAALPAPHSFPTRLNSATTPPRSLPSPPPCVRLFLASPTREARLSPPCTSLEFGSFSAPSTSYFSTRIQMSRAAHFSTAGIYTFNRSSLCARRRCSAHPAQGGDTPDAGGSAHLDSGRTRSTHADHRQRYWLACIPAALGARSRSQSGERAHYLTKLESKPNWDRSSFPFPRMQVPARVVVRDSPPPAPPECVVRSFPFPWPADRLGAFCLL